MFIYDKKLQYPVKIDRPNPRLAAIIISQYGGPDGELGASLRYLSQRYSMPFDELKGLLTDIGTEGAKCNRYICKNRTGIVCRSWKLLASLKYIISDWLFIPIIEMDCHDIVNATFTHRELEVPVSIVFENGIAPR